MRLSPTLAPVKKDLSLLQQLWPFLQSYKKPLLLSVFLLPLISVTEIAQPFLVRQILDGPLAKASVLGSLGQAVQLLWLWCAVFLGLLGINLLLRYWQSSLSQITGERIIYALRTRLYAHLQTLSPRFYHNQPIGRLVTRLTSDVEALSEMFSSGGIAILSDVAIIAGVVIGMFVMNPPLATLTSLMLPVLIVTMEFFRRQSRQAYDNVRVNVARMNGFLQENLSGMEVVQLYNRQARNYKDFQRFNQRNLDASMASVLYDCSFTAIVEFLTNITLVLVLWFGGQALTHGQMSVGLLVAFFWFVQMMFKPIEDVSEKFTIIQAGLASIDKILPLFGEQPEISAPVHPLRLGGKGGNIQGRIVFDRVSFGYSPEVPVLKEVSFTIEPGQTVAIVGPSGAGKTTLMKLLARFYDVTEGAIRVDGIDVRELDPHDLRRQIVVIQQDDFLFSRSLAENITLTPEYGPLEQALQQTLQKVRMQPLVNRFPRGLNEELTERGRNLSGGERQLVLFARAMVHNPPVLVLDEATSAVDAQTEWEVQHAMEELMQGRTVLVIAHRLSTLRQADRILVLNNGHIAESGTHQELLELGGLYASFSTRQETVA